MTKLKDLLWVLNCERLHPHNHAECFYPATSDDLVEVLADPEVQEALGAQGATLETHYTEKGEWQFECLPLVTCPDIEHWLVIPLSRLEDTDAET